MKLKALITGLICCCLLPFSKAQTGFSTAGGANFLGLARAGTALSGTESIYLNQAGITGVHNLAFDLSVERRYNLEELTQISLAAIKTFKSGTFGIMASNFGFSAYNEQKIGLAYGRKLAKNISLGGQLDMLRYNIDQVGSSNVFSFEIGMLTHISEQLTLGAHIFSPVHVKINDIDKIATRFRLGLKYIPSKKIFILADADKTVEKGLEIKIGVGYNPIKVLSLMTGFNTLQSSWHFGALLNIDDTYRIKTAIGSSHVLGNSPAISLQYGN